MTPIEVQFFIFLAEKLIAEAPTIAAEVKSILGKSNPTPDDWQQLKDKIAGENFSDLAPHAAANLGA